MQNCLAHICHSVQNKNYVDQTKKKTNVDFLLIIQNVKTQTASIFCQLKGRSFRTQTFNVTFPHFIF